MTPKVEHSEHKRVFSSGANRDTDVGKVDYEGCLSPLCLESFAKYMLRHSKLKDGSTRSSDNWQKGFPNKVIAKSLLRHSVDLWFLHRGYKRYDKDDGHPLTKEEVLCAIIFNAQAYLLKVLKK